MNAELCSRFETVRALQLLHNLSYKLFCKRVIMKHSRHLKSPKAALGFQFCGAQVREETGRSTLPVLCTPSVEAAGTGPVKHMFCGLSALLRPCRPRSRHRRPRLQTKTGRESPCPLHAGQEEDM